MAKNEPSDRAYVVGAGFSGGLGYPVTSDLLVKIWDRLDPGLQKSLTRIIKFHHPSFDVQRRTSYPDLEQLLSQMEAHRQLSDYARPMYGDLSLTDIKEAIQDLLWHVASWFDEIHAGVRAGAHPWLLAFRDKVVRDGSAIISFNWDLVLDELIVKKVRDGKKYGFDQEHAEGTVLLKPHGSLNWFNEVQAKKLRSDRKVLLAEDGARKTYAFTKFRAPKSKRESRYHPLIIPPHYMKQFDQPGFNFVWQNCVSRLTAAREVVFLGYSLPPSDFHAHFMLRCAFFNHVKGQLISGKWRGSAAGPAKVVVVNPDPVSARRIEHATTPQASFNWEPITVRDWVERAVAVES